MDALTPANLLAYSAQVAVLVLAATLVPALLRVQPPAMRYAYWRSVLVVALVLPWLQASRPAAQVSVLTSTAFSLSGPEPFASAGSLSAALVPDWSTALMTLLVVGAVCRGLWLATGVWQLARRRQGGRPADEEFEDLQRAMGTRAEIRYLDAATQPVMFGLRRPVVLLPATLEREPDEIRRAVVTHELWHVRRGDWAAVVVEEAVRAALWFHPAVWWVLGQIRASREQVVDALTVATTGQRSAYVRALLTFADATPLAPAAGFGWRRQLFQRVVQITGEDAMSTTRFMATALTMAGVVLASGWYGVRAFPLSHPASLAAATQGPGPVEQRANPISEVNPLPPRLEAVTPVFPDRPEAQEASMLLLVRTTVDESGAVAEVRVVRVQFRPASPREVSGTDDSVLTLHLGTITIEGDDALAKLEKAFELATVRDAPGAALRALAEFRPAAFEFIESALTAIRQWRYAAPVTGPLTFDVAVSFSNGTATASPAVASSAPPGSWTASSTNRLADSPLNDGAIRVGGTVRPPQKIKDVRPLYPPDARDARVQGVVILDVRIEADGRVGQARVLRSIPMLDQAALDSVQQWEFTPTLLNGVPTPIVMTVTVQFMLAQ